MDFIKSLNGEELIQKVIPNAPDVEVLGYLASQMTGSRQDGGGKTRDVAIIKVMRFQHWLGYAVLVFAMSSSARAADPVWWQVRTQNFVLYTDTSAAKGTRLLSDFESRFSEMGAILGGIPQRQFPIEVFLFEKGPDFLETAPRLPPGIVFEKSAHVVRGPDRIFVVARDKSPDDLINDAGHALGHVLFERTTWWRPFWLSEGAAEYFRKLNRNPDTKSVSDKDGFSAADLLKIVPSTDYDDNAPPTAFRVQSYRLLRVLLKEYRSELRDFLKTLQTAEGIKAKPNVPLEALEDQLTGLVETRINAVTTPAIESREISPAAMAIHRGDLLLAAGKTGEAAAWYNGDSDEARASRAILGRFAGSGNVPIRVVARAAQDFPDAALLQFHFGSIETQTPGDVEGQAAALERAVKLLPRFGRAYAQLARVYTLMGNGEKAFPLLDQAMALEPEFADQFLSLRAESYLALARYDDAKKTAELAAASPHLDRSVHYDDKVTDVVRRITEIRRQAESKRVDQIRAEVAATVATREPPPPPPPPPPPERFGDIQYEIQSRTATAVLNAELPSFPDSLVQRGAAGTITIQANVGTDGAITQATITNSQLTEMNARTLDAVKKWTFKPATSAGRAVAFDIRIIVRFTTR